MKPTIKSIIEARRKKDYRLLMNNNIISVNEFLDIQGSLTALDQLRFHNAVAEYDDEDLRNTLEADGLSEGEIEGRSKIFRDSVYDSRTKNKKTYKRAVAFFEMSLVEKIFSETKNINHPEVIDYALEHEKPHIAVQALESNKNKRTLIPYSSVEEIVQDFIADLACERLDPDICESNCPYQTETNKPYGCDKVYNIALKVLSDYSNSKKGKDSLRRILLEIKDLAQQVAECF